MSKLDLTSMYDHMHLVDSINCVPSGYGVEAPSIDAKFVDDWTVQEVSWQLNRNIDLYK